MSNEPPCVRFHFIISQLIVGGYNFAGQYVLGDISIEVFNFALSILIVIELRRNPQIC